MAIETGLRAVRRLRGAEPFTQAGEPVGAAVLDFWQWSSSDLLSNTLRGILAEFIVATALGSARETRIEWDRVDARSARGTRVEVKSAAYLQSWKSKPSRIRFDIAPRLAWDWEANEFAPGTPIRHADVYVFCLLAHQDPATVDPTHLDQWRFFVLPTAVLDDELGGQQTLGLARLRSLRPAEVAYSRLAAAIEAAF